MNTCPTTESRISSFILISKKIYDIARDFYTTTSFANYQTNLDLHLGSVTYYTGDILNITMIAYYDYAKIIIGL